MNMKSRLIVFMLGAAGLGTAYAASVSLLPKVGDFISPYGANINSRAVPERNITDSVSAVNFDYRCIDTLGEEFILFASVLGAVVLLREAKETSERAAKEAAKLREVPIPSDAVLGWTEFMTGTTTLFGIYIVTHGHLSPGGGFQGGVILATVPLLIYLSKDFKDFRLFVSHRFAEIVEGVGALGFIVVGILSLLLGFNFLQNFIKPGNLGSVFSGGTVPVISFTTGLEVAGGFALLLTVFLQKAIENKDPA